MKRYINEKFPYLIHGADYNPDQWYRSDPEIFDKDMRLMKLANFNSLTAGIFSWAELEPEEGKFNFDCLDRTMDEVYKNGGRVVLATPSGARPAWMSYKYPEVLRVNRDLTRIHHGNRHNHCYTSPVYREKVSIINRKLAERYKDHPALLVWHISNEYGGECYCPLCQAQFREWLKEKYGTLDNLNHQWWNAFWAHTYTSWDQIEPPHYKGETYSHGLVIDWKRFVSHQTADFMRAETAPLKEITPDIPVTTNLMGFYSGVDYRELAKVSDVISWDNYPDWRNDESDVARASRIALIHDLNRSMRQRPFMLMESTPSHVNWHEFNKLKRPGMHIQSSIQAIAHGSDTVQYFQWRKSRGGGEKFHGSVVDHEGTENTRVFREVSALGKRMQDMSAVAGTMPEVKTAVLHEWSNRWAIEGAQGFQNRDKKYMPTLEQHYEVLWKKGIDTDVISVEDDFNKYKFIIAPMLYSLSEDTKKKLVKYVENGGTLLCTYTTGYTNENDLCYLGGFPGDELKDLFGIWNEEIDTLYPNERVAVEGANGKTYEAKDYCELIHEKEGTEVLARYGSEFYKGMAAATCNTFGKGKAYYVAFRDCSDFTEELIGKILTDVNVTSAFDGELPYGVTAHSRTDGETLYVFLENYSHAPVTLTTAQEWSNAESGEKIAKKFELKPIESLVIARKK